MSALVLQSLLNSPSAKLFQYFFLFIFLELSTPLIHVNPCLSRFFSSLVGGNYEGVSRVGCGASSFPASAQQTCTCRRACLFCERLPSQNRRRRIGRLLLMYYIHEDLRQENLSLPCPQAFHGEFPFVVGLVWYDTVY